MFEIFVKIVIGCQEYVHTSMVWARPPLHCGSLKSCLLQGIQHEPMYTLKAICHPILLRMPKQFSCSGLCLSPSLATRCVWSLDRYLDPDRLMMLSRSRTIRICSNAASILSLSNRICSNPMMLLNSSQPSSNRMMALSKPSFPWNKPTS